MLLLLNCENRDRSLISNLLSINVPIILTQVITYPLLKVQTQLLFNKPQLFSFSTIKNYFNYLVKKQPYPKILQGIRYSLDHSITISTLRFLFLDWFITWVQENPSFSLKTFSSVAIPVISSTLLATLIGQPSLVQRTVSSSLSLSNVQQLTLKMKQLDFKKVATSGLKYSLLINFLSTSLDLSYLYLFNQFSKRSMQAQCIGSIVATFAISALIHPLHYLRISQISKQVLDKPLNIQSSNYFSGFLTSVVRRGINNSLLFAMYYWYNFYTQKSDNQRRIRLQQMHQKHLQQAQNRMNNSSLKQQLQDN